MAEQDWYGKTKFTQIDLPNGISKEVTYAWLPAAVGFAAGGLFLVLGDIVRDSCVSRTASPRFTHAPHATAEPAVSSR